MNKNIEEIINNLGDPSKITVDENEYKFRRNLAQNYLSYEETIYSGEQRMQDSLKKIHDYAKIWGLKNALYTLVEIVLPEPAQCDFDDIVDPDEEPDMVTGENRDKVLEMFNEKFDYDSCERDDPELKVMFNTLVDNMLANNLSNNDLEMVAMDIWYTIHSDIG